MKVFFGFVLVALVIIFTLQNVEVVTIRFLFWSFSLSRSLMIFIVFGIGVLTGWLIHSLSSHTRQT